MSIELNKAQKEGLARVWDTLAASAFIGLALGWTGHQMLTTIDSVMLFLAVMFLISLSLYLRKDIE